MLFNFENLFSRALRKASSISQALGLRLSERLWLRVNLNSFRVRKCRHFFICGRSQKILVYEGAYSSPETGGEPEQPELG